MEEKIKQELKDIESKIIALVDYKGENQTAWMNEIGLDRKKELESLLRRRRILLNREFLCTDEEVKALESVNKRLHYLTKKMFSKTADLYRCILKAGYDPDFDDDIMLEGSLRFVFDSVEDGNSILRCDMDSYYGSNFSAMMEIVWDFHEDTCQKALVECRLSYNRNHCPEMDDKNFRLDDYWDDGQSWNEGPLRRKELDHICFCYAMHNACCHKLYSLPDIIRMNDFWCEVKIIHQLLSDQKGERDSYILQDR